MGPIFSHGYEGENSPAFERIEAAKERMVDEFENLAARSRSSPAELREIFAFDNSAEEHARPKKRGIFSQRPNFRELRDTVMSTDLSAEQRAELDATPEGSIARILLGRLRRERRENFSLGNHEAELAEYATRPEDLGLHVAPSEFARGTTDVEFEPAPLLDAKNSQQQADKGIIGRYSEFRESPEAASYISNFAQMAPSPIYSRLQRFIAAAVILANCTTYEWHPAGKFAPWPRRINE